MRGGGLAPMEVDAADWERKNGEASTHGPAYFPIEQYSA